MKTKQLTIIVIILAAVAALFLFREKFGTVRSELKDFAVKDTASIDKIFLADKSGHEITLERKGKGLWMVNEKFIAQQYLIKSLLEVIYKIDVRTPVSKAAYNTVVKRLATNGIKCEIYANEKSKPVKVYYVGGQTEDVLGTFMMLENSSTPFITEIPGFNGYLTPRYTVELNDWRSNSLFNYQLNDLKSVSVSYEHYPQNSFSITNENGKFTVHPLRPSPMAKTASIPTDSIAIENYLSFFQNQGFETWERNMTDKQKDSILAIPAPIKVSVIDSKNNEKSIDLYPMAISKTSLSQFDDDGNPLKYDLDRMFGIIHPENEWVTVQHFSFDRILRQLDDFDTGKNKKQGVAPVL